jgi:hypothetical protein
MRILYNRSEMKRSQYSTEFTRRIYGIQPYYLGSKRGRSLALIIPARIARQCDITTDSMFCVKADIGTKTVTIETIKLLTEDGDENKKNGVAERLRTSSADTALRSGVNPLDPKK